MSSPHLSVVLPCYNESASIPAIVGRFAEFASRGDFELILVDNGSTDGTPQVLAGVLAGNAFARSVRVEKNRGYGDGILTGLRAARGEVLAWSHADMQTDPGDVFRALQLYESDADRKRVLIKGNRRGRALGQRAISRGMEVVALVLLRRRMTEINAQPKLFHRSLLDHLPNAPIDFNFDVYVLYEALRHGWHVRTIEVEFPPRRHGQSHWAATFRSRARTIRRSMVFMFRLGTGIWR